MRKIIILGVAIALAGCQNATTAGNAPVISGIDLAETALTTANDAGAAYINLPLCPQAKGVPCSNAATAATVRAKLGQANSDFTLVKSGTMTVLAFQAELTEIAVLIPHS